MESTSKACRDPLDHFREFLNQAVPVRPISEDAEAWFGRIALQHGAVSAERLDQAIEERKERLRAGERLTLGQVLLKRGWLTQERFLQILARAREDSGASAAGLERGATRRIGKYEIIREVGRGGMGVVYEAMDPDLGRTVALKTLNEAESDPKLVELLHREASTAAKLKHPNIVEIHEVGTASDENGRPVHFIAMDFVTGMTLADGMAQMSRRERIEVLETLVRAVAYAHEQGVVHRDLKPQNVLLEPASQASGGPRWRVYLTDFGLAKRMSGVDLTRSGSVLGTPNYMAPEQVKGHMRQMGPWTDVWALGVMLYEMTARRKPFDGHSPLAVYESILRDEPRPPRKLERTLHPDLETICLKALEKVPQKRYATAAAMAEDLRRYLRDEGIATRPAGYATRLRRHFRRRPAGWVAGIVGGLALAAVGGMWLSSFRKEQVRRRESAQAEDLRRRREAALQKLSAQWWAITERKREVMLLRVSRDRGVGDLEEAVRSVDAHIREWPDDPQGYYVRARGNLYLGDLARAQADVRTALSKRPDFGPGWSLLGMIKFEEYRQDIVGPTDTLSERQKAFAPVLKEAIQAFQKWEEHRGLAAWGLGETREDETANRVTQALYLAHADHDRAAARQLLEEGLAEYRSETYAAWLAYWAVTDADAIRYLSLAIELAPGDPTLWFSRGHEYDNQKDHPRAIADYTRAVELRSDYFDALFNRGLSRSLYKDFKGALEDLDRVVELRSDFAGAFINRGNVKQALKDLGGAVADYTRAIELQGDCALAYYNRGNARADQKRYADAIADYDRAIGIKKDYFDAYWNRAVVKVDSGDKAGAIADFEEVLRVAPPGWPRRAEVARALQSAREKP